MPTSEAQKRASKKWIENNKEHHTELKIKWLNENREKHNELNKNRMKTNYNFKKDNDISTELKRFRKILFDPKN